MVAPARVLGVDWGTSNRRAYLVDASGRCLRKHEDQQGALASRGQFASALQSLRKDMDIDALVPVVMSGMVGSAQGWQEVAYLDRSIPLNQLADHLVAVAGTPACFIVPGLCYREQGQVDVMRGEETQLLGALALQHGAGCYVVPGTHSKWVDIGSQAAGVHVMERLMTFITGELFALLGTAGTLAPLMEGNEDDTAALRAGALRAQQSAALTHTLFEARARVVTGQFSAQQTRSYVSGLLIGSEFAVRRRASAGAGTLHLIASDALSGPYTEIARLLGYAVVSVDPDEAYCAALAQLMEAL